MPTSTLSGACRPDTGDLFEAAGPTLIELHQRLIGGEAKDGQARGPTEVGASAAAFLIGGGGG